MAIIKGKYKVHDGTTYKQYHLETDKDQVVGLDAALAGKSDTGHEHGAGDVTEGAFHVDRIPSLNADKINAGTLHVDRIPELLAGKITGGTFDVLRIPDLNANKITAGTLGTLRIPDLAASKITSEAFHVDRIPSLNADKINAGTLHVDRIPEINANKITSGIIDIERIPAAALERLMVVANQAARFALTITDVQKGDTVQQEDTGIMYRVIDDTKLNSELGYKSYTAGAAASVPWSGVNDKPTEFPSEAHTHIKSEVGLANVENFGLSTKLEAEQGTSHAAYMTPLRTKEAILEISPPTTVANEYAKGIIDARSAANTKFWIGSLEQYTALPTKSSDIVYYIEDATGPQNDLDIHISNIDNPHLVTKAQVGLSNVMNLGIATEAHATSGTSNIVYMTPLRTKEAILQFAPAEDLTSYNNHIAATNNPHVVTKAQVGLTNVTDNLQATKTEFDGHTGASNPHAITKTTVGLANVTNNAQATKAEFDIHALSTANPHNVTKTQVGLSNVTNDAQVKASEKGVANGVATLDSGTKIPIAQIPDTARQQTYVVTNLVNLPTPTITGEKGFVTATGRSYIWDGSDWIILADTDWENINIAWANIDDVPASFTPSAHTHDVADVTGILGVPKGGTGRNTLTANTVLVGNGTSAVNMVSRSGIDTRTTFPPSTHTHSIANVTNLQSTLDTKNRVRVSVTAPTPNLTGDVWIEIAA